MLSEDDSSLTAGSSEPSSTEPQRPVTRSSRQAAVRRPLYEVRKIFFRSVVQ